MIDFSRAIELPCPPAKVWDVLGNLHTIESCLPGFEHTQEVEPRRRYRVRIRDRIGSYHVDIPLDVVVDSLETGARLAVKASGRDKVLASAVKVSMTVALAAADVGASLTLQGRLEVGGKLAALGEGVLGRKMRDTLHDFAANLERLLNPSRDADATERPRTDDAPQNGVDT
ncbi:MAG TPA: SRPBCC domain-containing protein [Candidatus Methylomirabilis sp.]|nr:SRPBCC domain-containing protein [Candidatus Methylomirabilis sp.]